MTQITPSSSMASPAPGEIEAFIGQVVGDLSAAFSGVLVNVGRKLGLYQAMADLGACTSVALAQATGIRERYVREWLANQAAGGYVAYDPASRTYTLPPGADVGPGTRREPGLHGLGFRGRGVVLAR
jgi:hypothetical protein